MRALRFSTSRSFLLGDPGGGDLLPVPVAAECVHDLAELGWQ